MKKREIEIEQLRYVSRKMKEAMREDPSAIFHIEFVLPSGIRVCGTIGPVMNGLISLGVEFDVEATPEDEEAAKVILDMLMGGTPEFAAVTHSKEERLAADKKVREMLGGGMG